MSQISWSHIVAAFVVCFAATTVALAADDGSVVITSHVEKLANLESEARVATVHYPVVRADLIKDKSVAREIQQSLSLKNALGESIADMKKDIASGDHWLEEITYQVNYNRHHLLDCEFSMSGMGPYPSTTTKHVLIDTSTGHTIAAKDVFRADALAKVKALVDAAITTEYQAALKSDNQDDSMKSMLDEGRKGDPLADFSVNDKGVTFRHDWQFPHVALANQPDGTYFFSYAKLHPYIKPDGPLGLFIK